MSNVTFEKKKIIFFLKIFLKKYFKTPKTTKMVKNQVRKTSGENFAYVFPRQFFNMLIYNIIGFHKKKIVVGKRKQFFLHEPNPALNKYPYVPPPTP